MTTPDPITTAREALDNLTLPDFETDEEMREYWQKIEAIRAALDYAEKLKAERDELHAEAKLIEENHADDQRMIDRIADIIGLPQDQELDTFAFELWASEQNAEITRLASQLEQAERMIIEYFSAKNAFDGLVGRGPIQEDEIETIRLNWVVAQRGASQWIKDHQAKGEAS